MTEWEDSDNLNHLIGKGVWVMGQYYRPLIIREDGELEILRSSDFDNLQKLMEHSWVQNNFVNAVYVLLWNNPCRVAWLGDYAQDDSYRFCEKAGGKKQYYKYCNAVWGTGKKQFVKPSRFQEYDLINFLTTETKGTYLINHTQKVYLSLERYMLKSMITYGNEPWCISPLPLLTACANHSGGSYRGTDMKHVGSWAFDKIEYTDSVPATYTEVAIRFIEG